jgi:hypothetical protein
MFSGAARLTTKVRIGLNIGKSFAPVFASHALFAARVASAWRVRPPWFWPLAMPRRNGITQ